MDPCVICGNSADERDHCPPKSLFPKPRPDDLITAPICSKCHEGTSKNDTYFRMKVAPRVQAGNHPAIRNGGLFDKVIRGLNRPQAAKLRKSFLEDLRIVEYDGTRVPGYEVDIERIRSVVRRTVRGLHWYELDEIADPDKSVSVAMEYNRGKTTNTWEQIRSAVEYLEDNKKTVRGDGIFSYRYTVREKEGQRVSAWLLNFYEGVRFLAIV